MKIQKATGVTNIIGVVFTLVGIIMIIIGIAVSSIGKIFEESAEKTDAVITEINTYYKRTGNDRRRHRDVFVEYVVDGKRYEGELNYYRTGMYEGGTVEIMYNPENPNEIRAGSPSLALLILGGIGILFSAIGIPFIVVGVKSGGKKRLKTNGVRMTGVITNDVVITNVTINGYHPHKAECEVVDSYTGERYLYSSDSVMNDISCYIGSEVDVYVDPDDKSRSYVDLESLQAGQTDKMVHDYR